MPTGIPHNIDVIGPIVAGTAFRLTVVLDQVVTSDTQAALSASDTTELGLTGTGFPTNVLIPAGHDRVTVQGLPASTASGNYGLFAGAANADLTDPANRTAVLPITVYPRSGSVTSVSAPTEEASTL